MMKFDEFKDIPMYSNWTKIEQVNKGWSNDKKFYIEDNKGARLLLRVSDISQYEVKRYEYDSVKKVSTLGITMSNPIDFGTCSDGEKVYSLLTWVDGEDAEIVLPKYDENKQYELGISAGEILKKIHSISAPDNHEDWSKRYSRKILTKIKNYKNCPFKIDNGTKFIEFLEDNISYLDKRPQTFHHGDYHVGNLIITQDSEIGVIDFNRFDFGDPWEEFNRLIFSWKVSIPFALGQIHGYFNNNVPDEFFRLMAVYITTNTISSIPWAIPFGEQEIEIMLNNAKEVFECYDGYKTYIPVWYKDPV